MATRGRLSSFSQFSGSKVVLSVVVLVTIAGLFLVPEILDLQKGESSATKRAHNVADEEALNDIFGDELAAKARSSGAERSPAETDPAVTNAASNLRSETVEERASLGSLARSGFSLQGLKSSVSVKDGVITWDGIRSSPSKTAMVNARRQANDLLRNLPARANASRQALVNFSNGISYVQTRGGEVMSAREASEYLGNLDSAVSRALVADGVDRSFLRSWSQISLGPVVNRPGMGDGSGIQFNPRITLTSIRIKPRLDRKGNPRVDIPVGVILSGAMVGNDIRRLEFVSADGTSISKAQLKRDPRGFVFFRRRLDGRQPWVLRAYDKYGEVFEKAYSFYPRAAGLPFDRRSGYRIPFNQVIASRKRFDPRLVDPRLDAFFRLGSRATTSGFHDDGPNSQFTRF